MNLLKYIGGAALLWRMFGNKATAAASNLFNAELLRPRLSDIHLLSGTLDLSLQVTNGTPADVVLNGYTGNVKRNGNTIATINLNGPINFPGGTHANIKVPLKITGGILREIFQTINNGGALAPLVVDSVLKTSIGNIPVKTKVEFLTTTFG